VSDGAEEKAVPTFHISVTFTIKATGAGVADHTYTPTVFPLVNGNARTDGPMAYSLVEGNNDYIPVPPGALYYMILPDPTSTTKKTVCNEPASFAGVDFTNQPLFLPVGSLESVYIYAYGPEDIQIIWI
jgi:hypothetical protein